MKSLISATGISITFLFCVLHSCSKSSDEVIVPLSAHNVQLKTLPLIQIKGYLIGSWRLHYSFGGFSGIQRTDYANSTVNFINGNYIDWQLNNSPFVQSPITWTQANDIVNVRTFLMQFKSVSGVPMTIGAEQILNDTLILYTNTTDGFKYYLTR